MLAYIITDCDVAETFESGLWESALTNLELASLRATGEVRRHFDTGSVPIGCWPSTVDASLIKVLESFLACEASPDSQADQDCSLTYSSVDEPPEPRDDNVAWRCFWCAPSPRVS